MQRSASACASEALAAPAAAVFWASTGGSWAPELSLFWDARGSHLDFSNPEAAAWWRERVSATILGHGIAATWNDNNEYTIEDEDAVCCGFGQAAAIKLVRPLMALLMCQASWRAQREHAPDDRPWLISRSGMPGMQRCVDGVGHGTRERVAGAGGSHALCPHVRCTAPRATPSLAVRGAGRVGPALAHPPSPSRRYVQTWSGDNYTSWETLRFNLQMGLGLALSGCFNFGHDVGGFAGPPPSPELLVRWLQNGIFHPRFTIHSWNADGSVTSPWMYPHAIPTVLATIQFRYALVPYLYQLLRAARDAYEPPLRPTFYDFEEDPHTWLPTDDFMCGPALLVANVMEEGGRRRHVYLPLNGGRGWYDYHEGTHHEGGQTISLAAPLHRIPLLAAAGSCIPMGEPEARTALDGGEVRYLRVFPLPAAERFHGVESSYSWTEDDGVTDAEARGEFVLITISVRTEVEGLYLYARARRPAAEIRGVDAWRSPLQRIQIVLPVGEERPVCSVDVQDGFGFELVVGARPVG